MSSLYLRGKSVWIQWSDRARRRRQRPTGFNLDHIERRAGRVIWPRDILDFKRQFDARLTFSKWDLQAPGRDRMKLSEVLDEFMQSQGSRRAARTQLLYRAAMKQLTAHFGDVPASSLHESDVQLWREKSIRKRSEQTTAKDLRMLSPVFRWAEEQGIVQKSPITRYVRFTPKQSPVVLLSKEETGKILQNAHPGARDQFQFLLLSGFRAGESCQLQWNDVDFEQRTIRLWNAKEARWDYFPMDGDLEKFLKNLPRTYSPRVFFFDKIHSITQLFRRIRDRLKLSEALSLHTFRANFISNLINSGLSESEVMHLARHRSIVTTHKYYVVFDQKRMRKALERSRRGNQRKAG